MSHAKQAWLKLGGWWCKRGTGLFLRNRTAHARALLGRKCVWSLLRSQRMSIPLKYCQLSLAFISMWHKWHLVQKIISFTLFTHLWLTAFISSSEKQFFNSYPHLLADRLENILRIYIQAGRFYGDIAPLRYVVEASRVWQSWAS